MFIARYCRIVKFWSKVVKSKNVIIKYLYRDLSCKSRNLGAKNWVYNVKLLLDKHGFSDIFEHPESYDLDYFCVQFRVRLIDTFVQLWNCDLRASRKLYFYKEYKTVFELEQYLNSLTTNQRVSLAKLRLSSHKLRIETGKYGKNITPRDERKCLNCNMPDLEDEYHFVLICPVYDDLREKYIKKYYYRKPSVCKFVELMSSKNINTIRNLSMYVFEAFALRKAFVDSERILANFE